MRGEEVTQDVLVAEVQGDVVKLDQAGSFQMLEAGDRVNSDQLLIAMNNGQATLATQSGDRVLNSNCIGCAVQTADGAQTVQTLPIDQADLDISALQDAIAAGADPTEDFEAPAAGEQGGNGTSDFVELARTGNQLLAEAGFDTETGDSSTEAQEFTSGDNTDGDNAIGLAATLTASISIVSVAGDNIVNSFEAGNPTNQISFIEIDGSIFAVVTPMAGASTVPVMGIVGGDVKDGDVVTLTVNGNNYSGSVNAGAFSIEVAGSDLAADTSISASVTATDESGNTATATDNANYVVDTEINASIEITSVAGDNFVDSTEANSNDVPVDGVVGGDVTDGDIVTLTVNGNSYTGTVVNGQFSINVSGSDLVNGAGVSASVTATDEAGNSVTAYDYAASESDGSGGGVIVTQDGPFMANLDIAIGDEDSVINDTVASNDLTPSGATFSKATDPANGSVVVNSDGSYSYTPNANFNGTDSFTYTVTDPASGESLTQTVTLTINPVTDLTAGDDSNSGNEDSVINGSVTANDSTTSGGTLSFAKASEPANGSVVVNSDGSYSYTPNANFNGTDSFTYTVTDPASGESLTQTVNLTINPVADLTAGDDANSGNEDTVINGSVTANDSTTSGGALTFAKASDPANGSVIVNSDGSYSYTPNANFNGTDSFTYMVTDPASGESLTQTVNLTINPVTDLTAGDDSNSGNEDTVINGSVTANDSTTSGGTLTFAKASDPANGSVVVNSDGSYSYTPNANFNGTDSFTYMVTDPASGESLTQTVNLTINPVTDLTAGDDSNSGNEDSVINGSVTANDSTTSGGTLSFAKASDPASGSVVVNSDGSYAYTPNANFNGTDSFTYTVTDPASGESLTQTVNLTINPVTDLTAGDDSNSGNEDTVINGSVTANDSTTSGGTLTFAKATDPSNGSVVVNSDGSYAYTPNANFNGTDSFTYTVTDPASGESLTQTVTLTINPVTDLTAGDDSDSGNEDTVINGSVTANDSTTSGGTLTFAKASDPANGSVVVNSDGSYSYTPNANFNGTDSFTYTVTDPASGESLTQTVNLTINPVTDLTAGDDSNSGNEDTVINGSVTANDSTTSGGTLSFAKASDPSNGSVVVNSDGSYAYTPNANFNGTDSFTYTVTDPASGESLTQTVTLTINPVTDLTAGDDSNSGNEDTVINGSVTANDSTTSGGTLSFAKASDPSNGSVVFNSDGSYAYTPNANFNGTDSFTYTVTDPASGESLTQTVTLTINPVTDLTAGDDSNSGNEDTVINGSVTANDSTTSGGTLTFAKASDPANGSVVVNSDGSYSYTPNANFNGTDSFTYTVTDPASGEFLTQTVNLTINPVTDLTAGDDANSGNEDTVINGSVTANDSTTSGGTLTFAKATDPANGSVVVNSDGSYSYTPNANFNGTDSFTYTVTDPASGESLMQTVNLAINPVADLTAGDDANSGNEDTVINGSVTANDSTTSGGTLTFAKATDPANGSVVVNSDGSYSYTPNANFNGTDSFTYTVTDPASGESLTQTVSLTINPVTDLTAGDDSNSGNEDTVINGSVTANDSTTSGGTLTFAKASDPANGSVVVNSDGSYSYTPNANFNGTDSFTYTVTDPASGESLTQTVNLTINPVTDLTAGDDSNSGDENTVINGSVIANDSTTSGGTLSFAKASDPANGSVVVNSDGSYSYTPNTDFTGNDSFTYTVTDPASGESLTQTVNLTVNPATTPPIAAADSENTQEDTAVTFDPRTNDNGVVSANLTITQIAGQNVVAGGSVDVGNGTVTLNNDGTLTFTPDRDFSGSEDFEYTVSNGEATDTATVTVTVGAVADSPSIDISIGNGQITTVGGNPVDITINNDNVISSGNGFSVSGRAIVDGKLADASHSAIGIKTSSPQGFGVAGVASGANVETGHHEASGLSEELIIDFYNDVTSIDVSFAWKHSVGAGEDAVYEFYHEGVRVYIGEVKGGSDRIDPAITLSAGGVPFDRVVFTAPDAGDDYLIHSIEFEGVENTEKYIEYPLTIDVAETDIDGSETLSAITISGIPGGASIYSNGVELVSSGGSVDIAESDLGNLVLRVDEGQTDFNLTATVTSTEPNGDSEVSTTSIAVDVPDEITNGFVSYTDSETIVSLDGDDILMGGAGEDTFLWNEGNTGVDTIVDFSITDDALDLSDLLQGENSANLDSYLNVSLNTDGDTQIDVTPTGSGSATQSIILEGVDLTAEYSTTSSSQILTNLVNDSKLITD